MLSAAIPKEIATCRRAASTAERADLVSVAIREERAYLVSEFSMRRKSPNRKYWIRRYIGECPVCGRDQSWSERVYGRKPQDWRKRIVYLNDIQTYDGCIGL